jgi:hypothetical protein
VLADHVGPGLRAILLGELHGCFPLVSVLFRRCFFAATKVIAAYVSR